MIYVIVGILAALAVIWLIWCALNWIEERDREMREYEDWGNK